MRVTKLGVVVLMVAGCAPERALAPIEPCTQSVEPTRLAWGVQTASAVDLLIVLDTSAEMGAAQRAIVSAMPAFIAGLVSGDIDGDGLREGTPLEELRVGVVSSDLSDPAHAGQLVTVPRAPSGVFEYGDGSRVDTDALAMVIEAAGTRSVATSQPLDTMLAALSPPFGDDPRFWTTRAGYVAPTFDWTPGGSGLGVFGGDAYRAPYVVQVVLIVTDRDDASIASDGTPYPIARYVDSFLGLNPDPEMLVLGVIAGVPLAQAEQSPADILAEPEPSCVRADASAAPTRLLEVARGLAEGGASVVVESVCAEDDARALYAVGAKALGCVLPIGPTRGLCAPASTPRREDGSASCHLEERLPSTGSGFRITRCSDVRPAGSRVLLSEELVQYGDASGVQQTCLLDQIAPAEVTTTSRVGWFLDDGSFGARSDPAPGCAETITLLGTSMVVGSEIVLVCDHVVDPAGSRAVPGLGSRCDPSTGLVDASGSPCGGLGSRPVNAYCDAITSTCALACTVDADCREAGLRTWACDVSSPTSSHLPGRCVSTTCE